MKRYRNFVEKRRAICACSKPKKREYLLVKRAVEGLQNDIERERKSRSASFIPFVPPPEMTDFEHPCWWECYLAGIAWLNCCLAIDEALTTYNLYYEAAADCIARHEV
jgi:hypothetical protein